ncbi:unnamed protein product [Moneuplotes crassus]|uniref:Uncharacterized protein n=1 Tax=Euplotes crassus TaxID=5936 RepID=A0AAD1UBT3_EUPCR|nr:unnamed protein product [Moneuplotes crassus]
MSDNHKGSPSASKYLVLCNCRDATFGSNLHRVTIDDTVSDYLYSLNPKFATGRIILLRESKILVKNSYRKEHKKTYDKVYCKACNSNIGYAFTPVQVQTHQQERCQKSFQLKKEIKEEALGKSNQENLHPSSHIASAVNVSNTLIQKRLSFCRTYLLLRKNLRRMENFDIIREKFQAEYYGYPSEDSLPHQISAGALSTDHTTNEGGNRILRSTEESKTKEGSLHSCYPNIFRTKDQSSSIRDSDLMIELSKEKKRRSSSCGKIRDIHLHKTSFVDLRSEFKTLRDKRPDSQVNRISREYQESKASENESSSKELASLQKKFEEFQKHTNKRIEQLESYIFDHRKDIPSAALSTKSKFKDKLSPIQDNCEDHDCHCSLDDYKPKRKAKRSETDITENEFELITLVREMVKQK